MSSTSERLTLPAGAGFGREAKVIALVAIASGLVSLALRDPNANRLDQEGARLAALLESARAEARASGLAVRWEPQRLNEGFRFVGWSIYDSFINWDLTRSDREAPLRPGLATKWYIDPANNKRWIFELRKGVKFHDGCDWNPDVADIESKVNDRTGYPSRTSAPAARAASSRIASSTERRGL